MTIWTVCHLLAPPLLIIDTPLLQARRGYIKVLKMPHLNAVRTAQTCKKLNCSHDFVQIF